MFTTAHDMAQQTTTALAASAAPAGSAPATLPATGYIRQAQLVPTFVPFSPATLWRKVASGEFPKPVKLSERVTAWRVEDVRAWMERVDGRDRAN